MECVCVDPFLTTDRIPDLCPFEKVYECDVVCVHTPLTTTGPYPTRHIFSQSVLANLKPDCVLLNAGRGGAINNADLLQHLNRHDNLNVVLDVWENEPDINHELLDAVKLGTPHIAGYSFEGRVNGSLMIHQALIKFLAATGEKIVDVNEQVRLQVYGEPERLEVDSVSGAVLATYDISKDHDALMRAKKGLPESFDKLRKNYWKRREFSHYNILSARSALPERLAAIGFKVD